ncbi:hypothetical protein [Desulfomonile tiedjei]|uniref:hypothetical protein n=1 Tax=Desulfomonile tiedjei TaxID=2358 RepID=UPI0003018439|nr:hypothetical protein [Desulfomonile tiedjei]
MTETQKRRISASKIVADIRSGMSEMELMQKYGLSENGLKKTLGKLVDSGHLRENEIPRRPSRETSPVPEPEKKVQFRCPSCDAEWTEDVDECPFCGVVIKKFLASRGVVRDVPAPSEDSSEKNWFSVIVSILICASIGVGLIWWSRHQAKEQSHVVLMGSKDLEDIRSRISSGSDSVSIPSEAGTPSATSAEAEPAPQPLDETLRPTEHDTIPLKESPQTSPQDQAPKESDKYVTGKLREFSSRDFKEQVVEASKVYPVILQFYSHT